MSELLSHWRIQESLFQGYRRMYLTLEAVLLSIGALSVSNINNGTAIVVYSILFTVSIITAIIFIPIINKRGELVFYWQAKILQAERGEDIYSPLKEMKEFQHDKSHNFRLNEEYLGLSKGKHVVRGKLNLGLPLVILFAWVGLGLTLCVK